MVRSRGYDTVLCDTNDSRRAFAKNREIAATSSDKVTRASLEGSLSGARKARLNYGP